MIRLRQASYSKLLDAAVHDYNENWEIEVLATLIIMMNLKSSKT